MDLFTPDAQPSAEARPPLAERMRPRSLGEFVGQEHLVGKGRFLSSVLQAEQPPSLIFWGPPGSGKTTLAHLIATSTKCRFVFFSAVLSGVKEVRELVAEARTRRQRGERTILFVDEIHRFNRNQQDAFLPHVEDGTIILMGATTENPSFEVNAPLLSRCKVLTLRPLGVEQVVTLLRRAVNDKERGVGDLGVSCDDDLLAEIAEWAEGDARRALNLLEQSIAFCPVTDGRRLLGAREVREAAQHRVLLFDKGREEHYNVISALIKSLRGSDPDAAVYWLARLLESGEDPLFVARRMVIFASEDVGNADPQGLVIAVAALQAFHAVGMPEGWIPLSHAATYLATAPKSNASYVAYRRAAAELDDTGTLPVPLHLRNAPTKLMKAEGYAEGYRYPHDYPGHVVAQQYLPDQLVGRRFYDPSDVGYEREIGRRLDASRKDADEG
ncbi:MAG TPA: replication-associated recombination protein A [Nitrospiria bacterium]|nr:replication-associated recombination protein A [Nitrospiria bacterium]